MSIAACEDVRGIVLTVLGSFDAAEADELRATLSSIGTGRAVTIDFRPARVIEDYAVGRLARELARRPLLIVGLSEHHHRILRYLRPEGDGGPQPDPAPAPGGRQRLAPLVLVVEDDGELRAVLMEFLSAEGYEVHEAADMADALRHSTDHRPTAILLDFEMPSAWPILQSLRTHPLAAGIPVVVISESDLPPDGACASLREPFDLAALAATLSSVRVDAAH